MSVIEVICPNCETPVHAPVWLAGKHASCRMCQTRVEVPPEETEETGADDGDTTYDRGLQHSRHHQAESHDASPQTFESPFVRMGPAPEDVEAPEAEAERQPESIESAFVRMEAPAKPDHGFQEVRPAPPDHTMAAILAATVGAVVGIVLWAAVSALTGYEIGWIAWGVGALVGGCAVKFGGRGTVVAIACSVLTLLAIAGGKLTAVSYILPHEVGKMMSGMISRQMYAEHSVDASEFAALGPSPSDDDVRDYMVRRGWFVQGEGWEIPDAMVAGFLEETAPTLRTFHEEQPPYETWRDGLVDEAVDEMLKEVSLIEIVKEDLSGFDLLWAILAVSSAFGIVMRRS